LANPAKAALQQARTALSYMHIVAPFDGLVTEKKADVGTLASPGMPIFIESRQQGRPRSQDQLSLGGQRSFRLFLRIRP
jgi:multidrug efflux pump subunit AcrA (membrane-fusion protein)